ncbi:MAG: site-specific DNA-methyltransferase [Bacteroidales bacterium]|nr:site-specific DNA-methyltransferase [Bacteroidales bacterium]
MQDYLNKILVGDSLSLMKEMPDNCIDCAITSPPYFNLRSYSVENQIGNEETPEQYVNKLVEVFHELKRILKPEGTFWLNIGDTWNGSKKGNTEVNKHKRIQQNVCFEKKLWEGAKRKDLIGIPWMLGFALRNDGWYIRNDIIWHRPNAFPKTAPDRLSPSYEHVFLLTKSPDYYFNTEEAFEPTVDGKGKRRMRDVWEVNSGKGYGTCVAPFPEKLIEPMIKLGCPEGGVVFDPFMGSGTTGLVALKNNRDFIGLELNEQYVKEANERIETSTTPT